MTRWERPVGHRGAPSRRRLGDLLRGSSEPAWTQALMTTGVPIGVHENAHCITGVGVWTQPWLAACWLFSPPGPYELVDSHDASWMKYPPPSNSMPHLAGVG